jgi:hypothetical protein
VNSQQTSLRDALKGMPVPPPRPGFVDDVLAKAGRQVQARRAQQSNSSSLLARWEMWLGVLVGAAAAVLVTVFVLGPNDAALPSANITLAVNESRNIDVLIDSDRALDDATISVAATGSVELQGLDDKHEVQWQARLERGRNVLSLPVVARSTGDAQLVAVVEHAGKKRRVGVSLSVRRPPRERVA